MGVTALYKAVSESRVVMRSNRRVVDRAEDSSDVCCRRDNVAAVETKMSPTMVDSLIDKRLMDVSF